MSVTIACEFRRETDAAILILDPSSGELIWIPLSQVEKIERDARGSNTGKITMTDWIAQQKGIE